jgi:hypothetical protein
MCLAEITTPAPKNEDLNRLPSFALIFFGCMPVYVMCCVCVWVLHACVRGVLCAVCVCCVCVWVLRVCVRGVLCAVSVHLQKVKTKYPVIVVSLKARRAPKCSANERCHSLFTNGQFV